jgi:SOS response regulatory protein OraA/RecX
MENRFLLDMSIKYGLSDKDVSKVVDMVYQLGYDNIDDREFQRAANYLCSMNLVSLPPEEVLTEMKRKGFGKNLTEEVYEEPASEQE